MPKKRIIYTGPFDPNLRDGVSNTIFDLMKFFKDRGHEVAIITFMHENYSTMNFLKDDIYRLNCKILSQGVNYCSIILDGISIFYEILSYSREEMLTCHPDVLNHYINKIKQFEDGYFLTVDIDFTCLLAHSIVKTSSMHFIHSPAITIHYLSRMPFFKSLLKSRIVFTVSKFCQEELKRTLNIDSQVWPPFVDSRRFRFHKGNKSDKTIGYYSAGPHKGDNLIQRIMNKMPNYRFTIMGYNCSLNIEDHGNYAEYTTNPATFYEKISLLLVPSIIVEGFPRVIIEASFNAIPIVANRIGGIPEALGGSGILVDLGLQEDEAIDKYIFAIEDLFNNVDKYEKYCKMSLERAAEYEWDLYQKSIYYEEMLFSM